MQVCTLCFLRVTTIKLWMQNIPRFLELFIKKWYCQVQMFYEVKTHCYSSLRYKLVKNVWMFEGTCNVVVVKCCPQKPTSLHTNCVILLTCLFTSIFGCIASACVDFVDVVLILKKTWLQLCPLQGWISGGYSALWEGKNKSKNNNNFYKKSNCWTGKKGQF